MPPAVSATATTRWQAALLPDTTICPGQLKFAGESTSPACRALPHTSSTAGSSRPMIETMPDGHAVAAACISSPRARTSLSPSSNEKHPASHNAVYSPRLRPAAASG